MTEALGIGAGIAGIASLTLQLYEQSQKISALLKSAKGFPEEVQILLEQLQILMRTLARAKSLFPNDSDASLRLGEHVTQQCQELSKLLQRLQEDMEKTVGKKGHKYIWKTLRATMRKDEIYSMSSRIQRACTLLHTINQMESHSLQSQQISHNTDQLGSIQASQSHHAKQLAFNTEQLALILSTVTQLPLTTQRTGLLDSNIQNPVFPAPPCSSPLPRIAFDQTFATRWEIVASYWVFFGTLQISNGASKSRKKGDYQMTHQHKTLMTLHWKLDFSPTPWLLQRGFAILGSAYFGNWHYSFRPYRLRPSNSAIFVACKKGDVRAVSRLLREGQASPFDINHEGDTPLHIAVRMIKHKICNLLIDIGADCSAADNHGSTPLDLLAASLNDDEVGAPSALEIAKLLVARGQCDPNDAVRDWKGHLEPFVWLLNQDHCVIESAYVRWTAFECSIHYKEQNHIAPIIEYLPVDFAGILCPRGCTILHRLFELEVPLDCLSGQPPKGAIPYKDETTHWCETVEAMVSRGVDVHALCGHQLTPLETLLRQILGHGRARTGQRFRTTNASEKGAGDCTNMITWWLAVLMACGGYDLHEYARREESIHPSPAEIPCVSFGRSRRRTYYLKRTFHYGDTPQDLEISFQVDDSSDLNELDDSHREFGSKPGRNPEDYDNSEDGTNLRDVPGAWPEEDSKEN